MKSIAILALLLGITFPACQHDDPPVKTPDDAAVHVKVAAARRTDMSDTLRIFGVVSLRQEAYLASQFDGRLSDFSLLLGDYVRKGDLIGMIVPAGREALLQLTEKTPPELRPVLEKQIRSIPLRSPSDGVVLNVMHHTGDVLQKGEQIVHIGDLKVLDVRGDLPVRYLPTLKNVRKVKVAFSDYPHDPLMLPLEAVSGQINSDKQTVVIRLRLDNPTGEFRPGMLARLSFPGKSHPRALTIPRSGLLEEEGVYSVLVVKQNHVEKRTAKVGILQDDRVEIVEGVDEGDRVVVDKAYSLEDGMEVVAE